MPTGSQDKETIDWNKVKIRCSSLYALFTEPKSKADKDAGNLSQTAKSHLIEVYLREIWNVEKDILTAAMKKGVTAEQEALALLSMVDGRLYEKNDERKENDWISGHADVVEPEEVVDTKCSWDAFSFMPKIMEEPDKMYYYQIQGYLSLWNKPRGRVSYCLVDTPDNIIQGEKYKLLRSMDVISEESPEFLAAAKKLESNMKFSHIPIHLRVINHYINRDEEVIAAIPQKVAKAREFLAELHEKHTSLNKNSIHLTSSSTTA